MSRRPIEDRDRAAIAEFIEQQWHSQMVMSRGKAYFPHKLEGFIDWRDERIVGLLTMVYEDNALQVLTLNSTLMGERIGSSLVFMAIEDARNRGIDYVWLTTTNDNLKAIGLYQKLGFRLVQVNVGAVDEARKIKPQIPEIGLGGIPIHDELVMGLRLEAPTC